MAVEPDPEESPGTAEADTVVPGREDVQAQSDRVATVEDVDRLRSERDAAVAALDKQGRRERRWNRIRRFSVGFLVLVFALIVPVTTVVAWAHNTVLNTNGWVRTVGPIGSDPAVTAAVSRQVTDELFTAVDAQAQIADALPPRASFLAAPITNGVKGYVQDAVNRALASQQFQTLWIGANRFAHQQLVSVLRGNTKALSTTNGQVVLNLVPLLNQALQQIQPFVSGVVGKTVNLPTISGDQLPAAACQKISSALGRPVPATCGQIPLFPADKLDQARRIVRIFDRATVLLLIASPAVAAVALWISRRRRRTLLQLSVGGLLGLVVVRRAMWWLQGDLVNAGKTENRAARQAILHQVTHGFFTASGWIIAGLALVSVVAVLTGPYRWARSLRTYTYRLVGRAGTLAKATVGSIRSDSTTDWVRDHLGALQLAGVVVAILLMLILSVSLLGFVIIAALVALYELWLKRLQSQISPPAVLDISESAGGGESPPGPPAASPSAGSDVEEAPTVGASRSRDAGADPPSGTTG